MRRTEASGNKPARHLPADHLYNTVATLEADSGPQFFTVRHFAGAP
jgi:hypothetical protein